MSQNSLSLPTTGTLSGLSLVEGINSALDTLNTMNSGGSAPLNPEACMWWIDTANGLIKQRGSQSQQAQGIWGNPPAREASDETQTILGRADRDGAQAGRTGYVGLPDPILQLGYRVVSAAYQCAPMSLESPLRG